MQSIEPWSPHQRATYLAHLDDPAGHEADLVQLIQQVARAGYLKTSHETHSPQPLMALIEDPSKFERIDPGSYLSGRLHHALDLLAADARGQHVRATAVSVGGVPEELDLELDDSRWTPEELAVFTHCEGVDDDELALPVDPQTLTRLLHVIARVYDRGHSSSCRKLVKSGGLTRAIRLLSSERLFPPTEHGSTFMIAERVRLLCDICLDSPQRPVADAAGLVLLEQELEESWSTRSPELAPWALEAATRSREHVLSLTELARQLDPLGAEPLYERLRAADFKNKRMRLTELSAVLDTHGDTPGVEAIARRALGVVFENLDDVNKGKLIERLFKDLERSGARSRRGWLKYVLEPIVLQNATNLYIQGRLVDLVSRFSHEDASPYMLFHLDAMREVGPEEADPRVVAFAHEHGSRAFIARLYPLTEATGILGTETSRGRAARAAIDAIIEREGLGDASGSLSVAQGAGGELSVAVATQGALSLGGSSVQLPGGSGRQLDLPAASEVSFVRANPVVSVFIVLGAIAALYLASAGVLAMLGAS